MKSRIIFTFFFLILICSCSFHSSKNISKIIGDGGFISNKPCGPTCFYGVIPGVTTYIEAKEIIAKNKTVFVNCEEIDLTSDGGGHAISCADRIGFGFEKQIVAGIGFSPKSDLTIQQVIDKYGPPNSVYTFIITRPDEPVQSTFLLYYDSLHTVVGMGNQNQAEFLINYDSTVSSIAYHSAKNYDLFHTKNGTKWHGYGIYEAKAQ